MTVAWQLHYTSARRGPAGRAGFQFVAETPGLPAGVRAAVTPYLSYRPPPDAPPEPGDAELDRFPVSLLYDRVDGRPLLLRCRYLGRDYSGRFGNFFAHAVVAEPAELEGLRPAELWRAPLWTHGPGPGATLAELDELPPGAALDPEALAGWLPDAGPADPYGTLAHLVDAVAGVLGRGHGRVVLVADDADLVARWIAVVSYSLPVAAAAELSFVTYTADPEGAAQRLVGTTPGVWAASRHHASHAFAADLRAGTAGPGVPSRFARTVAACWRDCDLAGLDALAELTPHPPALPGPADAGLGDSRHGGGTLAEAGQAGSGRADARRIGSGAADSGRFGSGHEDAGRGGSGYADAESAGAGRTGSGRDGAGRGGSGQGNAGAGGSGRGGSGQGNAGAGGSGRGGSGQGNAGAGGSGRGAAGGGSAAAARGAIGGAVPEGAAGLDGAAVLLALCRGDADVTAEEERAAAALLTATGAAVPGWAWRDLAPGIASMGLELVLAVREAAGRAGGAEVARRCAVRVAELALTDPAARRALPADAAFAGAAADSGELAARVAAALAAAPDLGEVAAVAAVAVRAGARIDPGAVTAAAADPVRRRPGTLAAAAAACPPELRDALLDGVLAGLADATPRERAAGLGPGDHDVLYADPARLRAVPHVAAEVYASVGRRRPDLRIAVTGRLFHLNGRVPGIGAALEEVWTSPPSAAECLELLDAHAPADTATIPAGIVPDRDSGADPARGGRATAGAEALLDGLAGRTFAHLAGPDGSGLAETAVLRLAGRVRAVLPDGAAARDAAAVQAHADAVTAGEPGRAARALTALTGAGAAPRLTAAAFAAAARTLTRRPPRFRADLLAAAPAACRAALGEAWLAELPRRVRAGRATLRGDDARQCNELVEVALRLRLRGAAVPALEAWAREAAAGWIAGRRIGSHLADEPELRAALRALADEAGGR